jgi:hypothetical protein
MQSRIGGVPAWARVEEMSLYATCPACALFLPDDTAQRGMRCPRCLRERDEAVLMRPAVGNPAVEEFGLSGEPEARSL